MSRLAMGVLIFTLRLMRVFEGGLKCRVQGSGYKVKGSWFRVQGARLKAQGSRYKVHNLTLVQGTKVFRMSLGNFRALFYGLVFYLFIGQICL